MPTINNIQPGQTVQMTSDFPALVSGQNCCTIGWTANCGAETFSDSEVLCVTTQTANVTSEFVTCDAARLQSACDYHDLYFANVDAIHNRLQATWANQSGSQGSPNANELYFWMTPYQNMTRMLVLAKEKGETARVAKYKQLLWAVLQDIVPRWLNGADATNGTGPYRNDQNRTPVETQYQYLSGTRALSWIGYAMLMMRKCDVLTTAEDTWVQQQVPRMKIAADYYNSELTGLCNPSHGGFSHMPSHLVTGMLLLEQLGGYSYPQANTCLNTIISYMSSNGGNVGSDISHDSHTVSNFMVIRDVQKCSGAAVTMTDSVIAGWGNYEANAINNNGNCVGGLCQSLPDYIAEHALAVTRSSAIDALVPPATLANYPNISSVSGTSTLDSINQANTVVSAAWGYAAIKDGEVCP